MIGQLPRERTCNALVFTVLDHQSRGWWGMAMTPRALRRLRDLRRELLAEHHGTDAEDTINEAAWAQFGN